MSAAPSEQRGSEAKRRPHGMLKLYYGLPDPSGEASAGAGRGGELGGPTDINGPHFDPEVFLTKEPFQLPEAAALADAEVRHPPPHRRDRFPHPRHRHDEAGPGLRRRRPQPGPHVQPAHPGREAINPGRAPSLGRGLPSQRAGRGRRKNSLGMLLACSRCGELSPLRKRRPLRPP